MLKYIFVAVFAFVVGYYFGYSGGNVAIGGGKPGSPPPPPGDH